MTVAATSLVIERHACRVTLRGTVQGVGMRPWLLREATARGIDGEVCNTGDGVVMVLDGAFHAIDGLLAQLHRAPPAGAVIDTVERDEMATGSVPRGFRIIDSSDHRQHCSTGIRPDTAPCPDCVAEIFDPESRRFRHALNNCNTCGPRASIQARPVWTRANTTNAPLPICQRCATEFDDPDDRRFHSEGINCPRCAPAPRLARTDGRPFALESFTSFDAVDAVASLIQRGEIVAIQSNTGFHLACDATHEVAVARLRQIKQRPAKPLALMARNMAMIGCLAHVTTDEAAALQSPAAPIVVLARRDDAKPALADSIAPGLDTLGVMLPATALHHLLFLRLRTPVVMTSANPRAAPLCKSAGEVIAQLGEVCDWIIHYDRDITLPVDDSVIALDGSRQVILRYGRGLAPSAMSLPANLQHAPAILASGGPWKSASALAANGQIILSGQLSALDSIEMRSRYRDNLAQLRDLQDSDIALIARDQFPECPAAGIAQRMAAGTEPVAVQHHHGHAVSCMVDNAIGDDGEPRLAIVFDGIGLGDDGSFWGGEFLLADYRDYRRVAALPAVPLPGGELAAREPWRNLWAHLIHSDPRLMEEYAALPAMRSLATRPLPQLQRALERQLNCLPASSAGRLFDAVAALIGIAPQQQLFEAQAALLLEQAARKATADIAVPGIALIETAEGLRWNLGGLWRGLLSQVAAGIDANNIALAFHRSLADAIADTALALRERQASTWQNRDVLLSGGVFQNRVLSRLCRDALQRAGLRVLEHHRVPANDGGLPIGQVAIAAARALHGGQF